MKHTIALLIGIALPGCAMKDDGSNPGVPPPPVVTDLSPLTADYGDTITITGTGFSTAGKLTFPGLPDEPAYMAAIVAWSDTQIVARVPFPATAGPLHVTAAGGETDTPALDTGTQWWLGAAATAQTLVAAQRFDTTTDALALDIANQVQLLSFGETTTQTFTLTGVTGSTDDRKPTRARLVGRDEVLANDAANHLIDFTVANGALVATDTGIVGELLAADAHGAWIQTYDTTTTDYELSHAKPGAPWTIDRGPIATIGILAGEIAADGTLVVAWSHPAGDILDNLANVAVAELAPMATALATTEYPEASAWDDFISSIELQISPDGKRMLLAYASQENDKDTEVQRPTLERDASGTWTEAQGLEASTAQLVFTDTTIAAFVDSADGPEIVFDVTRPDETQTVGMWPAQPGVLINAGSEQLPVVVVGSHVWAPLPPVL